MPSCCRNADCRLCVARRRAGKRQRSWLEHLAGSARDSRHGVLMRAREPAGVFVVLCLYAGCPRSAIEQGTGMRVDGLVGRGRATASALSVHDVERLARWCDWVVASAGYVLGEVAVEQAASAGTLAELVGCDLSAWAPRGVGGGA